MLAYFLLIFCAVLLLTNIGLGYAVSEMDRTHQDYTSVRIAFLVMNTLMIFGVCGLFIYLFFQLNKCGSRSQFLDSFVSSIPSYSGETGYAPAPY